MSEELKTIYCIMFNEAYKALKYYSIVKLDIDDDIVEFMEKLPGLIVVGDRDIIRNNIFFGCW